jgi:hypothetical protein
MLTRFPEGRIVVASDARRRLLYDRLVGAMGEDAAEVLMEHLPPAGWSDLATKSDVTHEGALLRAEMAQQGADLRAEMAQQGADLRSEIAKLGGELRTEMATQTRTLMLAMVTTMAASVGAAVGIVH